MGRPSSAGLLLGTSRRLTADRSIGRHDRPSRRLLSPAEAERARRTELARLVAEQEANDTMRQGRQIFPGMRRGRRVTPHQYR